MDVFEKIEAQQKKLTEGSAPWVVGEQLKDICRESAKCAELVSTDLDGEGMSLTACEKQIKAYADAHRKGGFSYVSPQIADGIIRRFYGLPEAGVKEVKADVIDLEDFL